MENNNKNLLGSFCITIIFVLVVVLISINGESVEVIKAGHVKIGGQILRVELAITPLAQTQGLSGRNGLGEDESMLFVFDSAGIYPFWMKDMNFAIDIIWIGEDGKVVYIKKDARPESYPETFVSPENALYVLEVSSGFSEKNNLKEGDRVKFLP